MDQTSVEKKVPHFIENIFRSGLTLVSSWDCFCQEDYKLKWAQEHVQ